MKVWDPFVRVAHWSLGACVLAAWITAESKLNSAERIHEWLGYAALAAIALRSGASSRSRKRTSCSATP